MELYGSIQSISGSMTASVFTGSFVGDGSGLYGISASGVTGLNLSQISTGSVTASVSPSGFNVNSDTSITGTLKVSGTIIAEQIDVTIYSSSVLYQSGSTRFGDTSDDVHNITGSVNITGSISLNGEPIGTGKLDETVFNSYTTSNDPKVSALEISTSSLNSFSNSLNSFSNSINLYTSSNDSRVSALESTTASLNGFTSSIDIRIKNKLNTDNVISGSIQVEITGTTGYSTFSSSIATTDLNQTNRLISIENTTSSLNNFSSSINTTIKDKMNLENVVSSSVQILLNDTTGYSTFSSSIATTDSLQESRLNLLEIASGSIRSNFNSYTSSNDSTNTTQNNRLTTLELTTSSLNTYTSSNDIRLNVIEGTTSSLNSFTSSTNSRLGIIETTTSSLNSYTSSNNTKLGVIESTTSSLNTFTSSTNSRLNNIETSTGSLNSFTSSINTTIKNKLNVESVISGSIQVDITQTTGYNTFSSSVSSSIGGLSGSVAATTNGLSSSVATYNLGQDNRLNSLEGKTGSYATTGSNIFVGNQIITGSVVITENLQVFGSSSITYVTASQLAVSTSFISVNVFEPAERFGGLKVYDSGSSNATASLAWDSLHNHWVYQNSTDSGYSGGMLIAGPRNTGSLGDEPTLTSGKIVKSVGGDHIDNSIMSEASGVIYVTGSLSATGTVYGTNITTIESATASLNSYTASNDSTNTNQNNRLSALETSTSSLNTHTSSTNTRLGLIETSTGSLNNFSSSTNTRLGLIETSTGSLNSFTNSINTTIKNRLNTENVISSSVQVVSSLPSGTVSGSSQVLNGTTIHSGSFFNGITVVSGSSQISFNGITDKPTLVSGSSQITYSGLSGVPSGIVSGSSQISFGSISGIPSGLVSGSSQISIGSTTGFSTYLDQAVKSGSTVTFNGITNTSTYSGNNIIYSTYNTATGRANLDFSVAKSIIGNIHIQNGAGPANDSSYQAAITFQGGTASESQAGIYVLNNNSYGTSMGFATTNSYGTGPQLFMTATNAGVVNFPRARPTYNGNTILDAANYTSYAMAGAGYSANQNLNTTSAVTFAGITNNGTYSGGSGSFSHNLGNPVGATELFVHNGANTPVPFRMTKAGYSGAGGAYGILQLYMNDNTNGNGANLYFCANSSNGTFTEYGGIGMQIKSNTAGSATARLYFYRQERAINGTFDSNGDLYTVGNIYVAGNGTTTGTQVVYNSGTWSINVSGNAGSVTNGVYTTSNNTMTGGNKIVIQNSQDGGSARGIFMWNSSDPNWGIYMAQSGAGKALNDGTAPAGIDGRSEHAIRFRVANSTAQIGFLWENSDNTALMQLQPNTGNLYTRGQIYAGNSTSNLVLHTGNYTSYAMQGAGYSANQNLNTSNTPTFAGANLTSRLYLNAGSYEGSILFGSNDVWRCGIRQHDDADAELRIWAKNANGMIFLATGYDGEPADISRPTDGLVVVSNNVGIGNFSGGDPSYKLEVKGTGYFSSNLTIGGTFTENSSIRYKKDIETLTHGLDKIIQMRGVSYIKKQTEQKEIGVIAEEIAEILPELVIYNSEGKPDSVSYGRITAVLIEAIKELKKEINELKNNG